MSTHDHDVRLAAALVSPLAPYDAPGLDWSAGMANGAVRLHSLALAGRDALQPGMARLAEALTATGLAGFVELAGPTLSRPDQAILHTDAAAQLYANLREGLVQGPEGAIEDALALVASWGVELAAVCVPVSVWAGGQDTDTPAAHARWLATAVPGAELRLLPDEGHLSLIYGRSQEVVDWLARQLRHGD